MAREIPKAKAEITAKQLDNIAKVTGVDAFCVFRTMDEKNMDAKNALLNYRKYYKKFESEGLLDNKEEYLDKIVTEHQKDKLKLASVLSKHAEHVLNLGDEMASRDPIEYMLSTVHEVNTNMPFASHNASDFGKSLAREFDQKVYADLDDADLVEMAFSGKVDKEVADVLSQIHNEDFKLIPDNPVHQVAKIIQDAEDYRYNSLNEAGANIEYRKNRVAGTWLRADMLQSVELDEVIEDFRKWLDPETFNFTEGMTTEEMRAKQYSTIKRVIENYIDIEDGLFKEVVEKEGLSDSYLKKYEGARQLKYKDSPSMLEAMNKYGSGTLMQNISNSGYSTAKNIGLMSRFGADPDLGYSMLRKHVLKRYGPKVDKLHEKMSTADNAYRHARGLMTRVGTSWKHDLATGMMAHTRVTKYGSIGLSALKDILPSIFALRSLTGNNSFSSMGKLIRQWGTSITDSAERKKSAQRAGLVLETHLQQALRRYSEEGSDPRSLSNRMKNKYGKAGEAGAWYINKMPDYVQKASFINPVTDANRTTFTNALALEFADMAERSWDDLFEGTQRGFKRAGISKKDWDILRKLDTKDTFGLNIETIARAPDSAFPDKATKKRLHKSMKMMFYDWANTSSPTGGLREDKIFGIAALDPNSTIHNVLRLVSVGMRTPIKAGSSTLKILYNQLGVNELGELKSKKAAAEMLHMATYAATTTFAIEQFRNLITGREMDDPSDYKTYLRMMQMSGALGIYGDFILSQSNKYGTDPSRALIGPGFGTVDDIIKGVSDPSLKALMKQLPMNNWYIIPMLKKQLLEEAAGR